MEHSFEQIKNNPEDYKFCPFCRGLNFKTNSSCIHCSAFPNFLVAIKVADKDSIETFVKNEINFFFD